MVKYNEHHTELDNEKVALVKNQIRRKWKMWFSFLFLGWSYGSLGNRGAQIVWYLIPVITAVGFYSYDQSREFTLLTSLAIAGSGVWIIWALARILTLNKAINHYNRY